MPVQVSIGHLSLTIPAKPLTPSAYAPYGDVIQNPRSALLPPVSPPTLSSLPYSAVSANQGSAIKYQHVSRPRNLYGGAPSRVPAQPAMNMFVCRARPLIPAHALKTRGGDQPGASPEAVAGEDAGPADTDTAPRHEENQPSYFPVTILERHPFTTQTFIPMASQTRYLVIVAPTLPHPSYPALPAPPRTADLPGPGLPDLERLEAFVAMGDQAVTYGAGTWHAPMAVLGAEDEKVDFVVVQFQNGVLEEDVQEVVLQSEDAPAGIMVEVGEDRSKGAAGKDVAKL